MVVSNEPIWYDWSRLRRFIVTSRRRFLSSGAAGILTAASSLASKSASPRFPYTEFESRIARRDFRDITKDVLPTPCMLVDIDMFEYNVRKMADNSKSAG